MKGTVLVVDEDVNAQIIAETLLLVRGFDVRIATDVTEAVAILAHQAVCVMIVDMSRPRMNGFEGVQRLRAAGETLPIPPRLVVVTDQREPKLKRFARRVGADAVLRKPMNPGVFLALVDALWTEQHRRSMSPARQTVRRTLLDGFLQRFHGSRAQLEPVR